MQPTRMIAAENPTFTVRSLLIATLGVAIHLLGVRQFGVCAERPLLIRHIDVGHGDATLIVAPDGESLLVDGGSNHQGQRIVVPLIRGLGIGALDFVLATHYDSDHIGGLDEVIRELEPAQSVLDRGGSAERDQRSFEAYADQAAQKRKKIEPGETINLGSAVRVTCVAAGGRILGGSSVFLDGTSENAASVALVVQYKQFDYFIGGDLTGGGRSGARRTADVESVLAPVVGDVDVVKLNHHGGASSSNKRFLTALRPEVGVISVGNGGANRSRYRYPSRDALNRILAQSSFQAIFMTNRGETRGGLSPQDLALIRIADGDIVITTNGLRYQVNGMTFACDGQTSLPPSGRPRFREQIDKVRPSLKRAKVREDLK